MNSPLHQRHNIMGVEESGMSALGALALLKQEIFAADDKDLTAELLAGIEELAKFVYVSRCHIKYLAERKARA
jgi:hypothetical protein